MKAICITHSGRQEMLAQCLASLFTNDNLRGWTLYLCGEPDTFLPNRNSWYLPTVSWNNGKRLGPELNTFVVCSAAIRDEAEAILYLDDDMLLSPDAIDLCNWYLERAKPNEGGLCLCNDASDPSRPESISPFDTWRGLVGQGYCYTRGQWDQFVLRNFWRDKEEWGGHGYDWSLGYSAVEFNRTIYRPRLSRSQHIGVEGHHGGRIFPEHYMLGKAGKFIIEES